MKTFASACYALIVVLLLEAFCSASALWSLEGVDLFGREITGTLELFDDHADLSLMLDGEDGVTLFDNSFARFSESTSEPPQIVLLQDFDGLKGGQLSLIGDNILSSEIEIGTQPEIFEGSIIIWDAFTDFQSASNIESWTRESVSVPEAAGMFGLLSGVLFIGAYCLDLARKT